MSILAAVDETERSRRVLEIGYDLATTYDEHLVVLHVIPEEDYDAHLEAIREIPGFEDHSITQQTQSAQNFASRFARETLDDPDLDRLQPRGRIGDIPSEILAEVDTENPRYLVIGGRQRSPARKAIFGDRAQQLLLNADCPVVTTLAEPGAGE